MTEWPIDILPLINRLAHEKPISDGLLVSVYTSSAQWPGNWQAITLPELEKLPFTQRYDLAVMTLCGESYKANDYEDNLKRNKPISDNKDNSQNKNIDKNNQLQNTPISQSVTHSITRLRDLLARRVLILASQDYSASLHALGFSQIEQLNADLVLWQFNILSYKQVPEWLNSRFWANPENWDVYRW